MPDETRPPRPIPDSYWVEPGRLLAGEYPGARHEDGARRKLGRLLDADVTYFLDLTEAGEHGLEPYAPLLAEDAQRQERPAVHRRMAIPDGGTPSAAEMRRTLDAIDAALQERHCVYVHCWGGIGRTGTVVGCYLVRHGLSGQEALDLIARRRAGTPDGYRRSPETRAQARFILDWPGGG
jgi:predicted protein tyrosine phosphatase